MRLNSNVRNDVNISGRLIFYASLRVVVKMLANCLDKSLDRDGTMNGGLIILVSFSVS